MCDPFGDLPKDYEDITMDDDDKPESFSDKCGICRYSSEILSKKPDHIWCVNFNKHVLAKDKGCEEYLPPRKKSC